MLEAPPSEQLKIGTHASRALFAGGKFYIGAVKNHVHIGFAINGLNEEEIGLFEGSGKTMRHVKNHSLEDIDGKKIAKLTEIVNRKTVCKPC